MALRILLAHTAHLAGMQLSWGTTVLVLTVRCFLTLCLCFCLGAVELLATLPLLHHTSSCCCFVLSHHVYVTKSSPDPTRAALLHPLFSLATVVGIQAELCLLERSHLCPAAEFCH